MKNQSAEGMSHLGELVTDPRNARKHNPRNIAMIRESLQKFGANRGIVIDENNVILAGNGVYEAASEAGIENVRVIKTNGHEVIAIQVDHLSEEDKRLYAVADNRTGELSTWNVEELAALEEEGINLGGFFFPEELQRIIHEGEEQVEEQSNSVDVYDEPERDNPYSSKIETPIYTPTMTEAPPLSMLADTDRRDRLIMSINESGVPEDVRAFLLLAAERHVVFDYQRIAEFYAHAHPEVQMLMEESALVIIDVDKAIEQGYVRAAGRLQGMAEAQRHDG